MNRFKKKKDIDMIIIVEKCVGRCNGSHCVVTNIIDIFIPGYLCTHLNNVTIPACRLS